MMNLPQLVVFLPAVLVDLTLKYFDQDEVAYVQHKWNEITNIARFAGENNLTDLQQMASVVDWDSSTVCWFAAVNGHLKMLQLEWEKGTPSPCRWPDGIYNATADRGHTKILEWLRVNECPH